MKRATCRPISPKSALPTSARSAYILAVLATMILAMSSGHGQEAKSLDVQVVKYDGLRELVLKNRGKVIIVDIWFTL